MKAKGDGCQSYGLGCHRQRLGAPPDPFPPHTHSAHLSGVSLEHGDDATTIGLLLTAGVISITVLGLVIIVVAVCKANPHEPWYEAVL